MRRSLSRLLLVGFLLLTGTTAAALADGVPFLIEPRLHATVKSSGEIAAGSTLAFDIEGLKPRNRFAVSLCGENCNSAKTVLAINGDDDTKPRHAEVHLNETGRYYFWVQQVTSSETYGPVLAESQAAIPGGLRVDYADGTRISVVVTAPDPGGAPVPSAAGRDRIEILSVSPGTATRGLETEFTIELDVELASQPAGVVMLGVNTLAPERYTMSQTLPVTRGPHRLTVHLKGVVVDWQERGHFGVQAHLGPKPEATSWKPLATAISEVAAVP